MKRINKILNIISYFLVVAMLAGCTTSDAVVSPPDVATPTETVAPESNTEDALVSPNITDIPATPTNIPVMPGSEEEGVVSSTQVEVTDTPTPTVTDTPCPTATNTPKPTATNTPKPTATNTPKPKATNTPKPTATNTPKPTATNTPIPITSNLEMHFIDVGQGDCTLVICDGEAMLIDAGDNNKGTTVQLYLSKLGIKELKYFIVTHGDSDHCGGADVIITKFSIGTLFMPEENKTTATYNDVLDAAKYKSLAITRPVVGNTYELGGAAFTILAPSMKYSDSNNNSIAIILTHGENTFLITGDAETESEATMIKSGYNIDADVYQAGHHGSYTASSEAFLDAVTPDYCVISCGEGNSYGHPHAETLNNLRSRGIKVYRTDEQGSIVVESDTKTLKWNASPSTTWLAGERQGSAATPTVAPTPTSQPTTKDSTYILNKSTKKFHYPSCSDVKKIAEKNYAEFTGTREQLINKGYSACGHCHP